MYLRWLSQGVYPEFIIREKWYGKNGMVKKKKQK